MLVYRSEADAIQSEVELHLQFAHETTRRTRFVVGPVLAQVERRNNVLAVYAGASRSLTVRTALAQLR